MNSENLSKNLSDEEFKKAKNTLRSDYKSNQNSLGVRIIGLVATLFTLFGAVQNSQKLSEIFPNINISNIDFTSSEISLLIDTF